MKKEKGLAIHCHHNILVEGCYDFDKRVKYIKSDKPESEQKIRLKVFKILPKKAEKDIPKRYFRADAEWNKANADLNKAVADLNKANDDLNKANAEWSKAIAEWPQESKDAFHKRWCGCKEW